MSKLALIAATNEPSHALLHGSEVCDLPATRTGSAPIAGWLQVVAFAFSLACRFTPPHVLIIAALTLLASPLFALGSATLAESSLRLPLSLGNAGHVDHVPRARSERLQLAGELAECDQLADACGADAETFGGSGGCDAGHGLVPVSAGAGVARLVFGVNSAVAIRDTIGVRHLPPVMGSVNAISVVGSNFLSEANGGQFRPIRDNDLPQNAVAVACHENASHLSSSKSVSETHTPRRVFRRSLTGSSVGLGVNFADSELLGGVFAVIAGNSELVGQGDPLNQRQLVDGVQVAVISGVDFEQRFHRSSLSCLCLPYPCDYTQSTSPAARGYLEISPNNPEIVKIPQESAYCQAENSPSAGIGDGWIAEIREARADLREHQEAIRESAAESREWRGLLARLESRLDKWDGSALTAFFSALWQPIATAFVGVYRLAWGLIVAIIAVCVARTVRELSDAYTVWKVGKT